VPRIESEQSTSKLLTFTVDLPTSKENLTNRVLIFNQKAETESTNSVQSFKGAVIFSPAFFSPHIFPPRATHTLFQRWQHFAYVATEPSLMLLLPGLVSHQNYPLSDRSLTSASHGPENLIPETQL